MILNIGDPKDSIRKLLDLIYTFSKVARYKNQHTKNFFESYKIYEASERLHRGQPGFKHPIQIFYHFKRFF
jgi:hypothetical protein